METVADIDSECSFADKRTNDINKSFVGDHPIVYGEIKILANFRGRGKKFGPV